MCSSMCSLFWDHGQPTMACSYIIYSPRFKFVRSVFFKYVPVFYSRSPHLMAWFLNIRRPLWSAEFLLLHLFSVLRPSQKALLFTIIWNTRHMCQLFTWQIIQFDWNNMVEVSKELISKLSCDLKFFLLLKVISKKKFCLTTQNKMVEFPRDEIKWSNRAKIITYRHFYHTINNID